VEAAVFLLVAGKRGILVRMCKRCSKSIPANSSN
jgi:hypothetical protein